MKKIAFLKNKFSGFGGEQRVLSEIANALSSDYEVTIFDVRKKAFTGEISYPLSEKITVLPLTEERGFFFKCINTANRITGILNHRVFNRILAKVRYPNNVQKELLNHLRNNEFDIIIGLAECAMFLGVLSDIIEAKTIGWIHTTYESSFENQKTYKQCKVLFGTSLQKLDKCLVHNEDIQSKYEKHFDVESIIMPNPRSFVSEKKSTQTSPMFVACGRFVEDKGFDLLIGAFRVFTLSNSDWNLTIIGDGPLRLQIEKLIKKYSLENRITITGFIPNVQEIMLEASVFLMSSRFEGFGLVNIEAFEVGLPVIAFDLPEFRPIIDNEKNGLLARPFDINAFAKQMTRLAENEEERKLMSLNAIEKAKCFSIENIMAKWYTLLDELLDEKG